MTPEMTVYTFAAGLASSNRFSFVVSDAVSVGELLIDPRAQTVTTNPNRTWTLEMNAGYLLPPNRGPQ